MAEPITGEFGIQDASYRAAGGHDGLAQLVDDFYHFMETLPEAAHILAMHKSSMVLSRKKLHYFLSGWLGGPKLYKEHFGSINIPRVHRHLNVGEADRDAWLLCMKKAIDKQPYTDNFKEYLITQLRVPANRVVRAD